jgi:hypothetical protein
VTTPGQLHVALVTLLKAALEPKISVYDSDVPAKPPMDAAGVVAPYIVVWPSAGTYPSDQADTMCGEPEGELDWPVQITAAAGNPAWVLDTAAQVRAKMAGVMLVDRAGRLREEPGAVNVQKDVDVSPPRWFVPLYYRTQTA